MILSPVLAIVKMVFEIAAIPEESASTPTAPVTTLILCSKCSIVGLLMREYICDGFFPWNASSNSSALLNSNVTLSYTGICREPWGSSFRNFVCNIFVINPALPPPIKYRKSTSSASLRWVAPSFPLSTNSPLSWIETISGFSTFSLFSKSATEMDCASITRSLPFTLIFMPYLRSLCLKILLYGKISFACIRQYHNYDLASAQTFGDFHGSPRSSPRRNTDKKPFLFSQQLCRPKSVVISHLDYPVNYIPI